MGHLFCFDFSTFIDRPKPPTAAWGDSSHHKNEVRVFCVEMIIWLNYLSWKYIIKNHNFLGLHHIWKLKFEFFFQNSWKAEKLNLFSQLITIIKVILVFFLRTYLADTFSYSHPFQECHSCAFLKKQSFIVEKIGLLNNLTPPHRSFSW